MMTQKIFCDDCYGFVRADSQRMRELEQQLQAARAEAERKSAVLKRAFSYLVDNDECQFDCGDSEDVVCEYCSLLDGINDALAEARSQAAEG